MDRDKIEAIALILMYWVLKFTLIVVIITFAIIIFGQSFIDNQQNTLICDKIDLIENTCTNINGSYYEFENETIDLNLCCNKIITIKR